MLGVNQKLSLNAFLPRVWVQIETCTNYSNYCLPDIDVLIPTIRWGLSEAKLLAGRRLGSILMQSQTLTFVNTVIHHLQVGYLILCSYP